MIDTFSLVDKNELSNQIAKTVDKLETQKYERISEKITKELRIEMERGKADMISERLNDMKIEMKIND